MAQIITLDGGYHNKDLDEANRRLTESGSWKKQRINYVIPGGDKIMPEVYLNHRGLIFPPNQAMNPIFIRGAEVGRAFQEAVDFLLKHPILGTWEYLLTIEHDNIAPQTGVLKLLGAMERNPQYDAISGLYWTKGEGGVPQIWGDIRDPVMNFRPQVPVPGQVVECWGLGQGFCLYRMEMFRKLDAKQVPRPWFRTLGAQEGDVGMSTQDLFFWGQVARPNGFRCAVDCDTLVGHIDERTGVIW